MIGANLIPPARLAGKQCRIRLRIWIILCSVYVSVVIVAIALYFAMWGDHSVTLIGEIKAAEIKTRDSSLALVDLECEISEVQAALDANKAMGRQPDWSVLLIVLARELGDEIVLNECKLSLLDTNKSGSGQSAEPSDYSVKDIPSGQRRYRLDLSGFGRTQMAVSRFVLRLERIGLLEEVKLTKSNRRPFMTDKVVAFRIECAI